jgi:Ca2+-binding EF-hand superfamily protein
VLKAFDLKRPVGGLG